MIRKSLTGVFMFLLLFTAHPVLAWKLNGHAATGIMAMQFIDETARAALNDILGATDAKRIDQLCNWPDEVEEQPEWLWAAPQHYVNLPRTETGYDRQRDCSNGLCLTEAVKKYAGELANHRLPSERREQAFAWLCHLVGDVHQPLHCGFADDRGGNSVNVEFDGELIDLHIFWDRTLIDKRAGSASELVELAKPSDADVRKQTGNWSPTEVDLWTGESHELAISIAYPNSVEISESFESQSWEQIRYQLRLGAIRLARILNATLGDGEVNLP